MTFLSAHNLHPKINLGRHKLPLPDDSAARVIGNDAAAANDPKIAATIMHGAIAEAYNRSLAANDDALAECREAMSAESAFCRNAIGTQPGLGNVENMNAMTAQQKLSELQHHQRDELEDDLKALWSAKLTYLQFKRRHGLTEEYVPPNKALALLIKSIIVLGESALNAPITGVATPYAGPEATLLAGSISVLNVGLGTLGGYLFRGIRHRDKPVRVRAWILGFSVGLGQLIFAYLLAVMLTHVEASGLFDPNLPIESFFKGGIELSPLHFSFNSLRLFGITAVFGTISWLMAFKGFLFPKYPGFSEAAKPYLKLRQAVKNRVKAIEEAYSGNTITVFVPECSLLEDQLQQDIRTLAAGTARIRDTIQSYAAVENHNISVYERLKTTALNQYELLMGKRKASFEFDTLPQRMPQLEAEVEELETHLVSKKADLKAYQEGVHNLVVDTFKTREAHLIAFRDWVKSILDRMNQEIDPWGESDHAEHTDTLQAKTMTERSSHHPSSAETPRRKEPYSAERHAGKRLHSNRWGGS